jgi:hypothetical protein
MPKPERPGWVTLLRYVWPHTLGLVLLVSAVVWGLRQTNSPETRAVAGALSGWTDERLQPADPLVSMGSGGLA